MFFRFPNIFDGVGLGIVPSRLVGFDRADVRFAVGRCSSSSLGIRFD
jgi:hypothetical protein